MSVTTDQLLDILKRIVESADSEGCTEDLTVVSREAVVDAEQAYREATGKRVYTNV
jgi:hypothetical protein